VRSPGRTCYVSMPFGTKTDSESGRVIDFDRVYHELIKPAVQAAGLVPARADELERGAVFLRPIVSAILGSDVMVADISFGNANVLYEVGVRHGTRRNVTVLVMESGTRIPSNVSFSRVLTYGVDPQGNVVGGGEFQKELTALLGDALARVTTDSPVFEFFSDLSVQLPAELGQPVVRQAGSGGLGSRRPGSGTPRPGTGLPGAAQTMTAKADPTEVLKNVEAELRQAADADPYEYITLLRRYRDESAWDELIRAAESMPPEVAGSPEVAQLLSLALNRRRNSGDQERALLTVNNLIQETGGDAESYGILGRIYKDQYEEFQEQGDLMSATISLHAAISAYRKGFEREPTNYYPGVNAVTLLSLSGDRQEAEELLPRVRAAVAAKLADGVDDYWTLATALELAVIARDWQEADAASEKLTSLSMAGWAIESTVRQLGMLKKTLSGDEAGRERLEAIVARLRGARPAQEAL
jgi:tetratricopeptide (TPR) repeat protein